MQILKKFSNRSKRNRLHCNTETGKAIHRKYISDPSIFQKERKRERAPKVGDTFIPKNRQCLRGVSANTSNGMRS